MEAHPLQGMRHVLTDGKFLSSHLRFSGGTPTSLRIPVPISFMAVTIGVTHEAGFVYIGHRLTNGNICLG